jgi:hypothetical protein
MWAKVGITDIVYFVVFSPILYNILYVKWFFYKFLLMRLPLIGRSNTSGTFLKTARKRKSIHRKGDQYSD